MVRKSCFILGIGLAILWWVGLSQNHAATILWFDAVAAVLAFGIAALLPDPETNPSRSLGPAVLGLGLAAVWIAGISGGQPMWASWLNLLFAMAFLGVATASVLTSQWVHARQRHRTV
jgi:hypothetical protein